MSVFTTMGITTAAGSETTSKIAVGTAGQIFTSNGTSSLPEFKGSLSTTNGIVKFDGTTITTSSTALIDASNRMTNTSQPSFRATLTGNIADVTGDGTTYKIVYNTEVFDRGSNYNPATGLFTAPVTGVYHFDASVALQQIDVSHTSLILFITTSGTNHQYINISPFPMTVSGFILLSVSGTVLMTALDTASIKVNVSGGTKVVDVVQTLSKFSGFLVS